MDPQIVTTRHDFLARRRRIAEELGSGTVMVLFAAPERQRSNDTLYPYRPDSDLHYVCGFDEPEAVAVIAPGCSLGDFLLFVRPRDPERELWDGYREGTEGAIRNYGADQAWTIDELEERLPKIFAEFDAVAHTMGVRRAHDEVVLKAIQSLRGARARASRAPEAIVESRPLLHRLRMEKDEAELERMRIAGRVSVEGHLAAMRAVRPESWEFEAEAALTGVFRRAGGSGHAYAPICAGGERACVLHYISNNQQLRDGDLILVDAGAEYEWYAGDITHTWPVGSSFSAEQRRIYEAVLDVERRAVEATVVGATNRGVHEQATRWLCEHLLDIGLLSGSLDEVIEEGLYRRFFMHGTGHYLGLDVHDVGIYYVKDHEGFAYREGMVLTVEPGIYIAADDTQVPEAFRGIGVRIEDNVHVRAAGPEVLTTGLPRDVEEIEAQRRSVVVK